MTFFVPSPSRRPLLTFTEERAPTRKRFPHLTSYECFSQKNPRVRKILVRNSGAGNGCVNLMDAWKKCVLSAGKTHLHKIPRFRGGYFGFWGGEVYVCNRYNVANWRSHRETVHFLGPKWVIFGVLALQK